MTHPERLAAGSLANINDLVFRYEPPIAPKRESRLGAFLCFALAMGAIVAWGMVL